MVQPLVLRSVKLITETQSQVGLKQGSKEFAAFHSLCPRAPAAQSATETNDRAPDHTETNRKEPGTHYPLRSMVMGMHREWAHWLHPSWSVTGFIKKKSYQRNHEGTSGFLPTLSCDSSGMKLLSPHRREKRWQRLPSEGSFSSNRPTNQG